MSRHLFIPEVIQTSAVDCGPACLSALLNGFDLNVSYGRLREACQTGVDGTSIDTMESLANQLGLKAEQIVVPPDHVGIAGAHTLPAIVVVRRPNGFTHFVVVWSRFGEKLQVMDPAVGRRWVPMHQFASELYIHEMRVPSAAWREWTASSELKDALTERMVRLGLTRAQARALIGLALDSSSYEPMAALDAAVRMFTSLIRKKAFASHGQVHRLLTGMFQRALESPEDARSLIPPEYWTVRPGEDDTLLVRGAVVVRATGRSETGIDIASLPAEVGAAAKEAQPKPAAALWRLLAQDGVLAPAAVIVALFVSAAGVIAQALLFKAMISGGHELAARGQRLWAVFAVLTLLGILLALEFTSVSAMVGMGRRLEARFRQAFLAKLPRIADPYFQSRLSSDMAERSHNIHNLRALPVLAGQLIYSGFQLIFTAAAVIWIDPSLWLLAILSSVVAVGLPLAVQPLLSERELRVRTQLGALSRFYLDSLLGLVAIRTHVADGPVRVEHRNLLAQWAAASLGTQKIAVALSTIQMTLGFGLAALLIVVHVSHSPDSFAVLLLAYWGLNIPVIGGELATLACQYPLHRNIALRILEPLGAFEETPERDAAPDRVDRSMAGGPGLAVSMRDVSALAGGRPVLHDITLEIPAGGHIAIIGPSGAGKSSLVGLLLGWRTAASGALLIDHAPLTPARHESIRRQTAWIDPAVQIWNRSVLENLRFGLTGAASMNIGDIVEQIDFTSVLERLPDGLQTVVGEGGTLVSGGEGQRVRVGRALARPQARLVIMDEPFRGLDAAARKSLLRRARKIWSNATLLFVTHDVAEAQNFDRVLVMEAGSIVEDGAPGELNQRPSSRYRALLEEEARLKRRWISGSQWRHLEMDRGALRESQEDGPPRPIEKPEFEQSAEELSA